MSCSPADEEGFDLPCFKCECPYKGHSVLWGPSFYARVCLGEQMFSHGKAMLRSVRLLVSSKLGWQQKNCKGRGNW